VSPQLADLDAPAWVGRRCRGVVQGPGEWLGAEMTDLDQQQAAGVSHLD
jgi:hypothetical protein